MIENNKSKYLAFKEQLIKASAQNVSEVCQGKNLNEQDNWGNTFLMQYYSRYTVKVRKDVIDYIIRNTDLNIKNKKGENLLSILIGQKEDTQLTPEQASFVIDNSDLSQLDSKNMTALMKLVNTPKNSFIEKNYAKILNSNQIVDYLKNKNPLMLYCLNIEGENYIKLGAEELLELTRKSGYSARNKMPADMVCSIMKYCATNKEEFERTFWNQILNFMRFNDTVNAGEGAGRNISIFQLALFLGLDINREWQANMIQEADDSGKTSANVDYIKMHKIKINYELALEIINKQNQPVKKVLKELAERDLLLGYKLNPEGGEKFLSRARFVSVNYFLSVLGKINNTLINIFTSKKTEINIQTRKFTALKAHTSEKPYTFKKELQELSQNLSYCCELELNAENHHNVKELYPKLMEELKKQCVLDYFREQKNLPRDENLKEAIDLLNNTVKELIFDTLKEHDKNTETIKKQLVMKMGK